MGPSQLHPRPQPNPQEAQELGWPLGNILNWGEGLGLCTVTPDRWMHVGGLQGNPWTTVPGRQWGWEIRAEGGSGKIGVLGGLSCEASSAINIPSFWGNDFWSGIRRYTTASTLSHWSRVYLFASWPWAQPGDLPYLLPSQPATQASKT